VAAVWARLEGWFAENHPAIDLKLRAPATAKQIAEAEKALGGVTLPAEFRESLLVHHGQDESPDVMFLPFGERLSSLKAMAQCWKSDRPSYDKKDEEGRFDWLSDDKSVRQVHMHPKHIAFAGSTYWDYSRLLFDFIPGPNGTMGQVIARDDVDFELLAPSFSDLLERITSGLEKGTIQVVKGPYKQSVVEYSKPKSKKRMSAREYFGM